jgi:hypothetical protein
MKMAKLKRTGECFQLAGEKMLDGRDQDWVLVHGAPTGIGGNAEGLKYPHAWIEHTPVFKGAVPMVHDLVAGVEIPARAYYALGNINPDETVRYTWKELIDMLAKHGTYGPWDEALIQLDAALEEIIQNDVLHGS